MKQATLNLLSRGLMALVLGLALSPASARAATESQANIRKDLPYQPIVLEADGSAKATALDALVAGLRPEVKAQTPVVVMIHGYDQTVEEASRDYIATATKLAQAAGGLKPAIVGLHWSSDAGSQRDWMLKATGHRLVSLLGFKKAIKNPYLEKVQLARQTGRTGLRDVLFRIQDAFPGTPVHVLAHSLGAEVAVSALSPECADGDVPVTQPGRTLDLGMVVLAGADLDRNTFCRGGKATSYLALPRAQVWWITVPEKDAADGVLELRRGARTCEAVGNSGLELSREDVDALLSRRALVLDQGVPKNHAFTEYYDTQRLGRIMRSALYLQQPDAAGRDSVLACLNRVLNADRVALNDCLKHGDFGCRLYAEWRSQPDARQFELVKVDDRGSRADRATMRTAGMRQEYRDRAAVSSLR